MKHFLRIVLALLFMLLLGAAALFWNGLRSLDAPLNLKSALRFKVSPGTSFAHLASDLAAQGAVEQPRAWILYARWKGLASAVKAGEYEIQPGITPRELLTKMVNGQVLLHSFTIVDGWRVQDLLEALHRNSDIATTLPAQASAAAQAAGVMEKIGAPGTDAEGQFLPETYRFVGGTTDIELLRIAHVALLKELDSAWATREPDLPLHNSYELLIMSSIVQKESGVPQELGKIAGLYLRRLSIGMRLQADPTIIYGMGERYDGDIRTVDLRTDGPYNTYTRAGLPPTPIALAGAAVIRATTHPEKTDALYFVASGKPDGSHVFSATLEAHNAAVAAYLSRQRQKAVQDASR
jgi:peptidoglycan lytic transglycosylase G